MTGHSIASNYSDDFGAVMILSVNVVCRLLVEIRTRSLRYEYETRHDVTKLASKLSLFQPSQEIRVRPAVDVFLSGFLIDLVDLFESSFRERSSKRTGQRLNHQLLTLPDQLNASLRDDIYGK